MYLKLVVESIYCIHERAPVKRIRMCQPVKKSSDEGSRIETLAAFAMHLHAQFCLHVNTSPTKEGSVNDCAPNRARLQYRHSQYLLVDP